MVALAFLALLNGLKNIDKLKIIWIKRKENKMHAYDHACDMGIFANQILELIISKIINHAMLNLFKWFENHQDNQKNIN